MSVHNSKAWELDITDFARFQHVLPKTEAVQFVLPGWSLPANKCYLELCEQDVHPKVTSYSQLEKTLIRSKKRNNVKSASELRESP